MVIIQNSDITILIDIDDVLNNLCSAWIDWLNKKHKTNVKLSDIITWDMGMAFPELTKEQIYEPFNSDKFWKTVTPRFDAIKYVDMLFKEGYNIYLCTSTYYKNIVPKYEYIIMRYFPYIDWEHVIIASNKQMIRADILIDDGIHNLEGGSYTKILMTASHNKNYDTVSHNMYRADDWEQVYDIIHGLNEDDFK